MSDAIAIPEGATTAAYIAKKWGRAARLVPGVAVNGIGAASQKILNNNPRRFQWWVVNTGAVAVYVFFDPALSGLSGILVPVRNGTVGAYVDEDGELVTQMVFANSMVGGGSLVVYEVETI